jgi:hypothetical protein
VNEEMLGWDASQIMASLRSNGWAVTGKLRCDQPDIFAPEATDDREQSAIRAV